MMRKAPSLLYLLDGRLGRLSEFR